MKQCIFLLALMAVVWSLNSASDELLYPNTGWVGGSPQQVAIEPSKMHRLFELSFEDPATQAVVLIKDGLLIGERYAEGFDRHSPATSWSMAKSFYAALIGISIDRGEIGHLDDKVGKYLSYFNDDRREITLRHLLDMTSGLENPAHEHENMFFAQDHLAYAKAVGVEKPPGTLFEYNNVNSMLLADILLQATGIPADELLRDRIFNNIGLTDATLWQDAEGNPLTYCCIDATPRQYARFGLLFARSGQWQGRQIIPRAFVDNTFGKTWDNLPSTTIQQDRGYSLHWWISRYDQQDKIFNASGKFGQYIFVDRANDMVFVRVTKYHSTGGTRQDWGLLKFINKFGTVGFRQKLAAFLDIFGLVNVQAPLTFEDGISSTFFTNYSSIMDALVDLNSQP
ncbi:MAG: beta-lactamase family protein [Porticoccaceae bacterium]|nr:beta-lactamase family protein [Porticoccaceae bacterium]